jgi:hypothetical protein
MPSTAEVTAPASGAAREALGWRMWLPCLGMAFASPLYFSRAMGVSQADLGNLLWMPPAAWGSATSSGAGSPTNMRPKTRGPSD